MSFIQSPTAGIVKLIRLENFMCHSSLQIELGDRVNFITGQNGSGKSAILTALCVAFGSRARGTQRASTLKDFIKTGCSTAVVVVEIKNEGEDAFKPDIYGDVIVIERRISESTSSTALKDHRGRKIASRKDELRELVEHFNIDVENPCVVMSQDKSREFLHSGNDKDKFKATLLQQVSDLLESINQNLTSGFDIVCELEDSIKPIEKELSDLEEKIENMKHLERITQELQNIKMKLAWSFVYSVDRDLKKQRANIEKLKGRIPVVQEKIDGKMDDIEKLRQLSDEKKAQVTCLMKNTTEVSRKKSELQESLSMARKKKLELQEEHSRIVSVVRNLRKRDMFLEKQAKEIHEQNVRSTQAAESQIEEKLKKLQDEVDAAVSAFAQLKEEESSLLERINQGTAECKIIHDELERCEKEQREFSQNIRRLQQHQTNKVTAFGGDKVINLLRQIERHHQRFKMPPIGPIGAHVTLVKGDKWASAVEQAIGKLLNAFIVTDHKDSLLLRTCAKEANYGFVQIVIYDFSKPRLNIPYHMLPQSRHPTTLSVIDSENHTVLNVLVDQAGVERQVLVQDYSEGKAVAFDSRDSNLKEVYTLDGYKMFSRASVQTTLPPNKTFRGPRLCSSFDDQIKELERRIEVTQEKAQGFKSRKRGAEEQVHRLKGSAEIAKRRRCNFERELISKQHELQECRKETVADASASRATRADELYKDISVTQDGLQQNEALLEKCEIKMGEAEAYADTLKLEFENFCKSAKGDIGEFEKAEKELIKIEDLLGSAEDEKKFYEAKMINQVGAVKEAESQYQSLEQELVETRKKASVICPEDKLEEIGGCKDKTPEQLTAQLTTLDRRLKRENPRFSESIDELRAMYTEKEGKILGKRKRNQAFRENLDAIKNSLDVRRSKLQRNADLLKRQITWEFNNNLRNKGISGHINVSYEDKTLSVQVKMPQDSSRSTVRDIRGLSGGERSFSTLCFALALHNMTESPFRAMDEFDVFMDAVSRKISLDTLVDFALAQGSQWIFITPHDIGMVKQDENIKKQQMAAPRS